MTFRIRSRAFNFQGLIPRQYTGEGEDKSPPLAWDDPPAGTQEYALIVDDPDAPRADPWVHWVLYRIPGDRRLINEGERGAGLEGVNDFGRDGWGGPMPPPGHGTHHYRFKLYALSKPLDLQAGATKDHVLTAMRGNVLGEADLVGTYERPREARAARE